MRLIALGFISPVIPLLAADLETQHAFDFKIPLKQTFELTLHSRIRIQPGGLGLYQYRVGPILAWDATRRITLLGGYYYGEQEHKGDRDFHTGHRLFAGTEVSILEKRRMSLDQRFLAERIDWESALVYNRYRTRTQLSAKYAVAPFTAHEFFFDDRGWRGNRHSAGIRWSLRPGFQVELGYLYENRRSNTGPDRQILFTAFQFKKPSSSAAPKR